MVSLLSFLWFIRTAKAVLFYIYLWQLKEYHIGRFLDHFRTEKGRSLILNKFNLFKVGLILIFPAVPLLLFFLLLIFYLSEFFKALPDFFKRRIKRPVLTVKAVLLISLGLLFELLFLLILFLNVEEVVWFAFWCLVFDILTPLIVSIIVLLFQPLAVLGRNQIIKKARKKREGFKNLLVIGITGSYGKTSTKEFLATILSEKFRVLKTKEHQNSEVGISLCILNDLKPEDEIFICEMGAYNRGGIKLLCDIAKPKIGVLTGINEQHMATFGSQENIIKGKYELIESLPEDGTAFFNNKNKYCRELYERTKIKKILYATIPCEAGRENILGATAVAEELGMTEEEIGRGIEKIKDKIPGIQVKNGINGLNILDAAYSANPDGVMTHLEELRRFPGKKIIVMPCLIELGKASKEVHKRIGRKIAEVCDLAIITTKDRYKEIQEGARLRDASARQRAEILFIEKPKDIFEKIKNFCSPGDVILLESRVPRQLIKQLLR